MKDTYPLQPEAVAIINDNVTGDNIHVLFDLLGQVEPQFQVREAQRYVRHAVHCTQSRVDNSWRATLDQKSIDDKLQKYRDQLGVPDDVDEVLNKDKVQQIAAKAAEANKRVLETARDTEFFPAQWMANLDKFNSEVNQYRTETERKHQNAISAATLMRMGLYPQTDAPGTYILEISDKPFVEPRMFKVSPGGQKLGFFRRVKVFFSLIFKGL